MLGRLTKSLGIRPGGRRMVLAVDDAHLLDDASAGLLLQLAGTGNVFVVASLDRLGATPTSYARLGFDVARGTSLAEQLAERERARREAAGG